MILNQRGYSVYMIDNEGREQNAGPYSNIAMAHLVGLEWINAIRNFKECYIYDNETKEILYKF